LKDKGTVVMFLGYAKDHSGDVYRFLKMGTKRVVLSRDVIRLNKLNCHHKNSLKYIFLQQMFSQDEVLDLVKNRPWWKIISPMNLLWSRKGGLWRKKISQ
jgi:hypothetical protein